MIKITTYLLDELVTALKNAYYANTTATHGKVYEPLRRGGDNWALRVELPKTIKKR